MTRVTYYKMARASQVQPLIAAHKASPEENGMNPTDTRAPPFAAEFDAGRSPAPDERPRRRASASMPDGSSARVAYVAQALVRRIRRRPWTSLLVAASGGFLLGGALSFRAGRLVLVAAARHVGREFLKQLL